MELYDIGIAEHQDLYKISKCGKVWSCKSNRFLTEKQNPDNHYKYVNIKKTKHYIHRLLAQTFLDNPNNLCSVDHIDNDIFNNHIHNLRWADRYSQQLNRCCGYPIIWTGTKNNKLTYFWEKTYRGKKYKKNSIYLEKVEEYREQVMDMIYKIEGELIPSPDKIPKFYKKIIEE